MHALAVPPVLQALGQAQRLLAKATPEMLEVRLAPGMFTCAEQFSTVAGFGLRAVLPLVGRDVPELPFPPADALKAAEAIVRTLTPEDFAGAKDRVISHRAGFADLSQPAADYLQCFALPNLWFHLAMAYAALRQAGAPVGKADFDGLHAYPVGFSFDEET